MLNRFAIQGVTVYQKLISPWLPACCRFYPSCSQYAKEAFRQWGFFKGGALALKRLLRCHPLHPGGYDPPPTRGTNPQNLMKGF